MIPSGAALRAALLAALPELTSVPPPAWIVGGAIRDTLLGRAPADVDLAAGLGFAAAQAFAARAGGKIVPLGRERFPTWRVLVGDRACDISEIIGATIGEDLARRDFTINAMALPVHGEPDLLDPFDGARDVEARIVRMVALRNLADDALRALKALRLAATLGFTVEAETLRACAATMPRLRGVAGERIGAELETMIGTGAPAIFTPLLRATDADVLLFGRAVPEWVETLREGDAILIWAAIFRDGDAAAVRDATRRLRLPSFLASAITSLLGALDAVEATYRDPGRLDPVLYDAGSVDAVRVASLARASGREDVARGVEARIAARGDELFSIRPLLDGDEIRGAAHIAPGPAVGRIKRDLILEQIAGRVRSKDEALAWLRSRAVTP